MSDPGPEVKRKDPGGPETSPALLATQAPAAPNSNKTGNPNPPIQAPENTKIARKFSWRGQNNLKKLL